MPNWCNMSFNVVLPKKNKDKYLDMFLKPIDPDNLNNKKKQYFARTFLNYYEEFTYTRDDKMTRLFIDCDCAWSVATCWTADSGGYPCQEPQKCPTMESVCKRLDVTRLIGSGIEFGDGFLEEYEFNKKNGFKVTCRDLTKLEWLLCLDDYDSWEESQDATDKLES